MTKDEWEKLPPGIKASLMQNGIGPGNTTNYVAGDVPYTRMGAPSLKGEGYLHGMNENTGGVTVTEGLNPDRSVPISTSSYVVYNPASMKGEEASMIRAHEMEHVLENQGGGQKVGVNERWDQLTGKNDASKAEMVQRLSAALPYLQKEWGLPAGMMSGYFDPENVKNARRSGLLLNEMFATLSALEQARNKSLTDDPYLRENVFRTPGERETYNAVTGLRQTRLDAKDLPPYTRQAEPEGPGFMDKIRSMLKLDSR